MALAIKLNRVFAQEDYGGYRHEFYREDDDRMNIDTDSASFDIGLGSHVRVNGLLVIDAISGATPTGAPPPATWPQLNFGNYYTQNYTVNYNNLFQSAINNNYYLYQDGYFPSYQAFTNYVAQQNPQIPGQAATVTTNNYKNTIASSPAYNSKQVPLTQLHDLRRAASFGVPITFGINTISPQVSISKESDYHSYGFALNDSVQLNQKNTTLNAGWSHDADRVRTNIFNELGNPNWDAKVTDDFIVGVTQLLTPKSYFTVDLTYSHEYGYLSDPYRGVFFANSLQNDPANAALYFDSRPRAREKGIFYASYTQFIDALDGSIDASYRFFRDTYGVSAQTVDTTWHQKITRYVVFSPGFRYYYQTAASFYQVIFPDVNNPPQYASSDYRLSRFQSFNLSAVATYRAQKHLAFDVSYSRYIMQGLDGVTSQTAYPSANVYSIGARIFF